MIKKVSLKDFKGHKNLDLELGRITILIGPNGTGKSSILQALMALRQTIGRQTLELDGPLINLGGFNDLKNKESIEGSLGIGIEVGIKKYPNVGLGENSVYSCTTYWNPQLSMFVVEIKDSINKIIEVNYERERGILNVVPEYVVPSPFKSEQMHIGLKAADNFSSSLRIGSKYISKEFDDIQQSKELFRDFGKEIRELISEFEKSISNVYYVPTIRGVEQPYYNLSDQYILDIQPTKNMQLATTFVYADDYVKEMVGIWSNEITDSEISVNVIPGKRVAIKSSVADGIPIIGDGFGANQLVHLLLMLAAVPKNSMLAIEEPEIHLHPKAQKKLVDILVEISKSQNKQLVFTTHSEHMLYGFLAAVKDGRLSGKEVAIHYFEEKGIHPVYNEIDEGADIYDWGGNFFNID